jgi:hypothetical protein
MDSLKIKEKSKSIPEAMEKQMNNPWIAVKILNIIFDVVPTIENIFKRILSSSTTTHASFVVSQCLSLNTFGNAIS